MASHRLTQEDLRRAETLVARIPGVSSCRIKTDADGQIAEVHVVATTEKAPKFVVRDVESALKAGLDLDVDYKKIGVVTVQADASPLPENPPLEEFPIIEHPSRFVFSRVNVVSSRDGLRAEVELTRDSMHVFGSSQSDNPATSVWNVVADATLRAVSESLDEPTRLCLGGVLKVPLGGGEAVVVRVDVVGARYSRSLAGCAIVSGDENQGVVFATLDAVNRLIGKLDFKNSIEYKIK